MTYANVTSINMAIIIIAAIMYLVGFILTLIGKEKYKRKSKVLCNIALTIAMIIQIISLFLVMFKTGMI